MRADTYVSQLSWIWRCAGPPYSPLRALTLFGRGWETSWLCDMLSRLPGPSERRGDGYVPYLYAMCGLRLHL